MSCLSFAFMDYLVTDKNNEYEKLIPEQEWLDLLCTAKMYNWQPKRVPIKPFWIPKDFWRTTLTTSECHSFCEALLSHEKKMVGTWYEDDGFDESICGFMQVSSPVTIRVV